MTVLLVAGARDLRQTITASLGLSFARIDAVSSIAEARRFFQRAKPNLVLLDPDHQSEDVLSFVSELDSLNLDVMILTQQCDVESRIDFFERNILDVIPKPIDMRELSARVMRFYKRKRSAPVPTQIEMACGAATLDITHRLLRHGRKPQVRLTGSEFRLLYLLIQNEAYVVERSEIARAIMGQAQESMSRSIDVMISKLRRKLDDIESERQIKSVRSEGYMLIGEERHTPRHGRISPLTHDSQDLVSTT